jgi:hypothetical protein
MYSKISVTNIKGGYRMKTYHRIMIWYYGKLVENSMSYEERIYYYDKLLYHDEKLNKEWYMHDDE